MSLQLFLDGGRPITLGRGDRFEIAADCGTDALRLVRRDWDGTDAGLTFDPGAATSLVMRKLGSAGIDAPQPALENALKPLRLIYQRSRRRG